MRRRRLAPVWLLTPDVRHVGRTLAVYGLVGALAGITGVLFQAALAFITEALGVVPSSAEHLAGLRDPDPFPWLVLVLPSLGGLASGLLCAWLAPEAMGSGSDRVVGTYHTAGGRMRGRIPLIKGIASIFTIGAGGSAGIEGPTGQITAGIGSIVSDILGLSNAERRIVVIAGMAGGIGAVFHAPMAAAILSAEVLYAEMDMEHEVLVPSIISSTIAYAVFGAVSGWEPSFTTPALSSGFGGELLVYTVLAVVLAMWAAGFVQALQLTRRLGSSARLPLWLRPAIGGLGVGVVGVFVPGALGPGYGIAQTAFLGHAGIAVLLLLAAAKTLTSALTTGSGGAGGLFAPAAVVGAALGGAVGLAAADLAPGLDIGPAACGVVGMAGMVAALFRTPLAAVIMVSELVGDYRLLVPALWVCILAFLLSRGVRLLQGQVGSRLDDQAQLSEMMGNVLDRISVREAMDPHKPAPLTVAPDAPLSELVACFARSRQGVYPIVDPANGHVCGVVDGLELRRRLGDPNLSDLVLANDFLTPALTIAPTSSLRDAMQQMSTSGVDELLVVRAEDGQTLLGILSRRELVSAYHRVMLASHAGPAAEATPKQEPNEALDLPAAIRRGGVVHGIAASTKAQAFRQLIDRSRLPPACDQAHLEAVLLEREALGSTGIGEGFALPHPSADQLDAVHEPTVVVGLLDEPIDWDAIDSVPVHAIFLLLAPSGSAHLELLSGVARLLTDARLRDLLRRQAPEARIIAHIQALASGAKPTPLTVLGSATEEGELDGLDRPGDAVDQEQLVDVEGTRVLE